jgi:hypothetical protein
LQFSFKPRSSINKNHVIPAQAGIQIMKKLPRQWGNILFLSADETTSHSAKLANNTSQAAGYSRAILFDWIPAFAGMTA